MSKKETCGRCGGASGKARRTFNIEGVLAASIFNVVVGVPVAIAQFRVAILAVVVEVAVNWVRVVRIRVVRTLERT